MAGVTGIKEVAISLPFTISSYNKISTSNEQPKIWADRVRSAIGTLLKERVMRPRYGTSVPSQLFDTQEDVSLKISTEIERVFFENLPSLSLSDIIVDFNESENVIYVEVTYEIPNQTEQVTRVGLAVLSGNNPIYEENI